MKEVEMLNGRSCKYFGMSFDQLKENLEKGNNFDNFKLSVKERC